MLHHYPYSYLQDDLHKIPPIFHFNACVTNYPKLFNIASNHILCFCVSFMTKNVQLLMNMSISIKPVGIVVDETVASDIHCVLIPYVIVFSATSMKIFLRCCSTK